MFGALITSIVRLFAEALLDMALKLAIAHQRRAEGEKVTAKAVEDHLSVVDRVLTDKELTDEEANRLLKESARRVILS